MSNSTLFRRHLLTQFSSNNLIAIKSDGLAYIEFPWNAVDFLNQHPRLIARFTNENYHLGQGFNSLVNIPSEDTYSSTLYGMAAFFVGPYDYAHYNVICTGSYNQMPRRQFVGTNKLINKPVECYFNRIARGRIDYFVRDYKTKEEFTLQIYNYAQERGVKTQLLRAKGIHLYAMYTDSMTLLPHYNGSTYGLMDINSGTFYGNSNSSGRFRGVFGRSPL